VTEDDRAEEAEEAEKATQAGRVPGAESALAAASLSLLQRIILTSDGTVGRILEQFAGEPMMITKLSQALERVNGDSHMLDNRRLGVEHYDQVLRRSVLIQGARSGSNFLYAESLVRADSIEPDLFDELVSSDIPLGHLFSQRRLETFREVLGSGEQDAGVCGQYFGMPTTEPFVFRTYRIMSGHRPIVLITEKFPLAGSLAAF
jgi:chorismate-pyruvate lyase